MTLARRTGDPVVERTAPRGVLAVLCVTVTVSYGTLYYAFAVLGTEISRREGWSLTVLTAGLSTASLIAGLVGIPVGRAIQHSGPRRVMSIGAVIGAAGLAGMAAAPSAGLFFASMLVSGVGAAGLFYAPAFAAITHWYGEKRVRGPFAGAAVAAALGGHGPMFAVFGLVALVGTGLMAVALPPASMPTRDATADRAGVP